jgi:bifunctional oligoribonuclease and PAP phosphatase NrnA
VSSFEPVPRCLENLKQVAKFITDRDEWLIVTHERPDGDAIGSALAMAHILSELRKRWTVLIAEPMPKRFDFLPLFDQVTQIGKEHHGKFKNVIAVDCADVARFDNVKDALLPNAQIVNIDHHQTNPRYGVVHFVDEYAAATCELVFHLARYLGISLTDGLAKSLYTGILTDTGGFAYPNTTREVHQIAAELLASGVRPYDIAEPALESRTKEQMHLLRSGLANLRVSEDGLYASLFVTRQMLKDANANDDDAEGLVGFARSIETVEVGVLFRETLTGQVKVSLRSKRLIDVSRIAQSFGGGGHIRASGCTIDTSLEDAMKQVESKVRFVLTEGNKL